MALAKGKHGAEHGVALAGALALACAGRLQAARLPSNWAMDLALEEGQRETAASYRAARAVWEGRLRKCRRKKKVPHGSARAFQGRGGPIRRRSCPGFSGESSRSEALAGDLESASWKILLSKLTHAPHSVARKALEIVRSHGFTS